MIFVIVLRKRAWAYLAQGRVEIGYWGKLVKCHPLEINCEYNSGREPAACRQDVDKAP